MTTKPTSKINYKRVYAQKTKILKAAYANFEKCDLTLEDSPFSFDAFCLENKKWLNDYALYAALRKKTCVPWYLWPSSLRKRRPKILAEKEQALKNEVGGKSFCSMFSLASGVSLRLTVKLSKSA
jgi:4-alpha-glucanotransferase